MIQNQFDRYALSYSKNRDIQDRIAQKLLSKLPYGENKKIIDIGCGDGALYEKYGLGKKLFVGVDASHRMCELHSKKAGCIVVKADFDDPSFADAIVGEFGKFDVLLSSSALQWSSDISSTLGQLSKTADHFAISIFTRGTFTAIREFLGVDSFLPTVKEFECALGGFHVKDFWIERFKREFDSPRDALRYIKHTGVSGGGNKISYQQAKKLYESGPSELVFEVAYAVGSFAKRDFSIS